MRSPDKLWKSSPNCDVAFLQHMKPSRQTGKHKNSAECDVSPVSALSQNRAKCKNSTKVYASADNDDTGKAAHMSHFC